MRKGFRNPSREYLTDYFDSETGEFNPEAYRRFKSELAIEDEKRDKAIREENKTHGVEQMKFAYALMKKMESMLGGPSRLFSWFISVYKDNPNLPAVTEEIKLGHWKAEVGIYEPVNIPDSAKKAFFEPTREQVLAEKVDQETGEVLNPGEPTQESAGF